MWCVADNRLPQISQRSAIKLGAGTWLSPCLEMGRNSKRKSSESSEDVDGSYEDVAPVTPFKSGFFVPCHPLLTLGKQNLLTFRQLLLLPDIFLPSMKR